MKNQIFLLTLVVLAVCASCENTKEPDPDILFATASGLNFKFEDIRMYDSSTHILYLKKSYPEFETLLEGSFAFLDNGDTIYSGAFLPGYSSYIPSGPIISSPDMYGGHALRIEIWRDDKPDIRNNQRLIDIMKAHNILHSGLSAEINSLEVDNNRLIFSFTITNEDQSDLLILDINKMGPNLFHYFTNGLYVRDINGDVVFENNFIIQNPESWDSFAADWLTPIKSGESLAFSINYNLENGLIPGQYSLLFEFPGLSYQVREDQLFQDGHQVWLGDITLRKKMTLD